MDEKDKELQDLRRKVATLEDAIAKLTELKEHLKTLKEQLEEWGY